MNAMTRTSIAVLTLLLLVSSRGIAQETPRPDPPRATVSPGDVKSQLFQVVLLTASVDGPEALTGLPKNAEKAIADVKDFLPYRAYRLLDSGLLRAAANSMSNEVLLSGEAGGKDREFRATLRYREKSAAGSLFVEQFNLFVNPEKRDRPLGEGVAPPAPKRLIDTSFAIDQGETVVVGSSKLNGSGKAVIVLLTALPKS